MSFYDGYLMLTKLRRWRQTSHRYYCVLDQYQLIYYTHHHDTNPRGTIDLRRYTTIETPPTSPSRLFFSCNNKAPGVQSFQLTADHPDLPDFLVTAESTRSKKDWLDALDNIIRFLSYDNNNNNNNSNNSDTNHTVLEKWLERFELSAAAVADDDEKVVSRRPSSSSSSSSSRTSSRPVSPRVSTTLFSPASPSSSIAVCNWHAEWSHNSISPSAFRHDLISRQQLSPSLRIPAPTPHSSTRLN